MQALRTPGRHILQFASSSAPQRTLFARTMAIKPSSSSSHGAPLKQPLKLACIQLAAGADKAANLARARDKVREAAAAGARLVVLPECFNSPYGCDYFPRYAEQLAPYPPPPERSPSFAALRDMARETGTYLVGGSVPELEVLDEHESEDAAAAGSSSDDAARQSAKPKKEKKKRYYNTSLVFGPDGSLLATHRKVHLFDIDIPGGITFRESDVLSPGNKVTLVDLPGYGRVGLAICYDIRFPELATIAARRGCFALLYPGAFNTTTGPMHWTLLSRARAVDNQIYVALCSPARDPAASYHAWGHSMVVDPMARVLAEAGHDEEIVYADLEEGKIEEARKGIPLRDQRRFDVYPDISQGKIRFEDADQK